MRAVAESELGDVFSRWQQARFPFSSDHVYNWSDSTGGKYIRRRISPVCPFARNAEGAAIQLPEQESVNAYCSALLQNFEAVAAKRMEWVTDLRPS